MSRATLRFGIAALAALFLFHPSLQAAEAPQAPHPYVVLVGIGEYKDPAIKPRAHAEADIKALYDLLADKNCFNCSAENIKLLLGSKDEKRPSEPATRENVLKAIRWALQSAGNDDLVLIAFAGQGAPVGDRTCYFAVDSTLKNRVKDAIGAGEIEQEFDKVKSTRICVLLDVNFMGYDAGSEKIPDASLQKRFTEFDGAKEDSDAPPKPIVCLSATNGLHPSVPAEKNSLFMSVVLDGLRGQADTEGNEADGLVTVDELAGFVRKEFVKRAPTTKLELLPREFGISTHFPVTKNAAVTAQVEKRLDAIAKLATDGKLEATVAAEAKQFLSQMPRLEAQRKLRKKYQQLADGNLTVEELVKERQLVLDSLKLPREEALTFADGVLKVARLAKELHVQQLTMNDLVVAAVKGLYKHIEEKLPDDLKDRLAKVKGMSEDELRTLLADVRQKLGNREDLKGQKGIDTALEQMVHTLDTYSGWISPEEVRKFERDTPQSFIGVGIQIEKEISRDMVRISTPLRGSPAYKAGVKAGDVITHVTNVVDKETGKPLAQPERISTKGMLMDDVVNQILGEAGTPVILTLDREGVDKPIDIEIKRGQVDVETVLGVRRNQDDSWDYYVDPANKIAYIRLTQFAKLTEQDLKQTLQQLRKEGLKGLVLDLRFNPGGYLHSAVGISDLFIDDGLIVTIRKRGVDPEVHKGRHGGSLLDFPLVVLINGRSASASEIVSAAIQDHGRGILMGERSFGKGSVQNIIPTSLRPDAGKVKLSIASYWRPSGKNIDKEMAKKGDYPDEWGVLPHPDYALALNPKELGELYEHLRRGAVVPRRDGPQKDPAPEFKDKQLDLALKYLREQAGSKATTNIN